MSTLRFHNVAAALVGALFVASLFVGAAIPVLPIIA